MPATGQQQVVEFKPGLGDEHKSRPLKTGKEFILVVRLPRVIQLRWDRASYQPGDRCQLTIDGTHLGNKPLDLTIEVEDEQGVWSAAATVQARVDGGEAKAVAAWKFPEPPNHAAAVAAPTEAEWLAPLPLSEHADGRGELLECHFGDGTDLTGAQMAWVVAKGTQLDGAMVDIVLEREQPDGQWAPVGKALSTVKAGEARAGIPLDPADSKG